MKRIKGIIFDMDNTLLRSNIDFKAMKNETFEFLASQNMLPKDFDILHHTTSTLIEEAIKEARCDEKILKEMWEIPRKYEVMGMINAPLEPGVLETLKEVHGKYHIAIVTNNSLEAAEKALRDNKVIHYFDLVVGRELMKSLKPSPDGFHYVLKRYKNLLATDWISIGDSWIDGKASNEAGIPFITYRGDIHKMNMMGVEPQGRIMGIREIIDYL